MWIRCPPCARQWATHFTPTHLILPTVFWTTHCCWGLLLIYAQRQPGNALLRSLAVGSTAMVPAAAPSHPSRCLIKPPFSQSIPSSMTKPPGQSTPLPVRCRTPGEVIGSMTPIGLVRPSSELCLQSDIPPAQCCFLSSLTYVISTQEASLLLPAPSRLLTECATLHPNSYAEALPPDVLVSGKRVFSDN